MNDVEVINKLKEIISPYVENKELLDTVTGESDLLADLKVNSANLIDIILDVEDAFDIEIDDGSAENMFLVKDVIEIITKKMKD